MRASNSSSRRFASLAADLSWWTASACDRLGAKRCKDLDSRVGDRGCPRLSRRLFRFQPLPKPPAIELYRTSNLPAERELFPVVIEEKATRPRELRSVADRDPLRSVGRPRLLRPGDEQRQH